MACFGDWLSKGVELRMEMTLTLLVIDSDNKNDVVNWILKIIFHFEMNCDVKGAIKIVKKAYILPSHCLF